jgi:hypothetical protein
MFVPHRRHVTSPLRAQKVIYRFATKAYYYNCHNSGYYPYIRWIMFVPQSKHVTSPLWARQVNAIYRFVTTVYLYNCHNSGHYPSSRLLFNTYDGQCSYLKANTLRLRYEPNRLMRSIGLWRRYINITVTILDIFHRPVLSLRHRFGDWILSPHSGRTPSVEPNRTSLCLQSGDGD